MLGNILLILFGVKWLGHGRATEFMLFLVALTFGLVLLFFPSVAADSGATVDIVWRGYEKFIAIPFILKAILSGYGLLANIRNWPLSRSCRFIGALIGLVIWVWYISKFTIIGQFFASGVPFFFWASWFSIRIMAISWANRPIPGAPGAL